jgi:hypothetical protein
MKIITSLIASVLIGFTGLKAQQDSLKIIELSGVVMTGDENKQFIPFAHILVKGRNQITATNEEGFFSIPVLGGDTVIFSHLGFSNEQLYVPDTLGSDGYLSYVMLSWDTTVLDPIVLYPWPNKDNFKDEFLAMRIDMTEQDLANRNLALQTLKDQAAAMGYDAEEMQNYMIRLQNQNIYNQGRYYGAGGGAAVVGALTNPFAWAELFNAVKRGDFKKQ